MSVEYLGQPLTDTYSIPGGQARLYQRGLTINGPRGEAIVAFAFPMIGRPAIVTGDPTPRPLFSAYAIRIALGPWRLEQLTPLIHGALAGRLALMPTGQPGAAMPLTMAEPTERSPGSYGISVSGGELQSGAVEPGWLSAMWMIEYEG